MTARWERVGLSGESQGMEQGGSVICKPEYPHTCSQEGFGSRPVATSMASFQRETYRSSPFSGTQFCFLKAQEYTGTPGFGVEGSQPSSGPFLHPAWTLGSTQQVSDKCWP